MNKYAYHAQHNEGISGSESVFDGVSQADPVHVAAQTLFGISYLFPYQRLVIANIVEAAQAAGFPIDWTVAGLSSVDADKHVADAALDLDETEEAMQDQDRACHCRQIIILPTGAGKSLCFQIPAMLLAGPTLVIYPLLSLMADQERRLKERGFEPVILRGGQSAEERNMLWEKLHTGKSRFIIANPEVLLSPQVLGNLARLGILHIVIDEAHCVSEWGENFRPSYLELTKIIDAATAPGSKAPLVSAFTATASIPVLEKITQYIFGGQDAHRIMGNPDRSNISYAAQGCILRDLAVRDLIIRNARPALVFCSSRLGTERLAHYLRNELRDTEIRFYHAGLNREEKRLTEQWFFTHDHGILTATCAYGMGVDKADIRTVIHRDCPPSVEAYLQESGRSGRDKLPAKAILLWGPDDPMHRARSEADRLRLSALLAYARNTAQCRREHLLALLNYTGSGEHPAALCCDVCAGTAVHTLREETSLLEFFRKNRRRYTLAEAAHLLSQVTSFQWSEDDATKAIKQLVRYKFLKTIKNPLWKNKLTVSTHRLVQ